MKKFCLIIILLLFSSNCFALSVIPNAPWTTGFGMDTTAGAGVARAGSVICHVDTLADDGSTETNQDDGEVSGSLRYCLEDLDPTAANYGKVIIFDVSGTIYLDSPIAIGGTFGADAETKGSYITVAGQTAPSPGISLGYYGIVIERNSHDILIEHIRFRTGDQGAWFYTDDLWADQGGNVWEMTKANWAKCIVGAVFYSGVELTKNTATPTTPALNEWGIDGSYNVYINIGGVPSYADVAMGCYKPAMPDPISLTSSYDPENEPPWYPPNNIVLSHLSLAWGTDIPIETGAYNITVTDTIIGDAMGSPLGPKGEHPKGLLSLGYDNGAENSGGANLAVVRNLFMRDDNRNPMIAYGSATVANNLVFDWHINGIGVDDHADTSFPISISIVGNYTIETLQNSSIQLQIGKEGSKLFLGTDNFVGGAIATDPYNNAYIIECHTWSSCTDVPEATKVATAAAASWPTGYVSMTAAAAKTFILVNVGARPGDRDSVDLSILTDTIAETDSAISQTTKATNADCYGDDTPFDCCSGAGTGTCPDRTFPSLAENVRILTPPVSWNTIQGSGYTLLEEWLDDYNDAVSARPKTTDIDLTGTALSIDLTGSGVDFVVK